MVVDALRDDASRAASMTTLNGLRAKGRRLTMTVGQPSLSVPGWSVIGTGAWQEESGVTTNWFKGAVKTDSIFAQAKRRACAPRWWAARSGDSSMAATWT